MGKWIVDIHGEIEGDYELIAKYADPKTEDDILKAIMFNCANRLGCKGCRYLNNDTVRCRLVGVPAQWELE